MGCPVCRGRANINNVIRSKFKSTAEVGDLVQRLRIARLKQAKSSPPPPKEPEKKTVDKNG